MNRKSLLRHLTVLGVLTLTIALGGCSGDKTEKGSEAVPGKESSQVSSGEPSMGGSIVVGIPQDLEDSCLLYTSAPSPVHPIPRPQKNIQAL